MPANPHVFDRPSAVTYAVVYVPTKMSPVLCNFTFFPILTSFVALTVISEDTPAPPTAVPV